MRLVVFLVISPRTSGAAKEAAVCSFTPASPPKSAAEDRFENRGFLPHGMSSNIAGKTMKKTAHAPVITIFVGGINWYNYDSSQTLGLVWLCPHSWAANPGSHGKQTGEGHVIQTIMHLIFDKPHARRI